MAQSAGELTPAGVLLEPGEGLALQLVFVHAARYAVTVHARAPDGKSSEVGVAVDGELKGVAPVVGGVFGQVTVTFDVASGVHNLSVVGDPAAAEGSVRPVEVDRLTVQGADPVVAVTAAQGAVIAEPGARPFAAQRSRLSALSGNLLGGALVPARKANSSAPAEPLRLQVSRDATVYVGLAGDADPTPWVAAGLVETREWILTDDGGLGDTVFFAREAAAGDVVELPRPTPWGAADQSFVIVTPVDCSG